MRAYEWPKKMVEIMKDATSKANGEHKVRLGLCHCWRRLLWGMGGWGLPYLAASC